MELLSESSKSDPDYEPGKERLEGRGGHSRKEITFEMKRQVVRFWLTGSSTPNQRATFREMKRRFRWIKHPNQLVRFKRQVESCEKRVLPEKRAQARQHKERVAAKYRRALAQGFRVSTIDIYGWAAEEARKIGYTRFKGSNGWLTRFRAEYNIQPRRDNKLLIGFETQSELEESSPNFDWNNSNQDVDLDSNLNLNQSNNRSSNEPLVLLEVHETSIFEPN